jgi:hypothetical protein
MLRRHQSGDAHEIVRRMPSIALSQEHDQNDERNGDTD